MFGYVGGNMVSLYLLDLSEEAKKVPIVIKTALGSYLAGV